jgi:hypothetical protein
MEYVLALPPGLVVGYRIVVPPLLVRKPLPLKFQPLARDPMYPEVALIAPVMVADEAVNAPAAVTLNVPEPLLYSIELMIPEVILPASRLAITVLLIGDVTHEDPFHEYWPITMPAEYCHQMSPTFVPEPLGADVE